MERDELKRFNKGKAIRIVLFFVVLFFTFFFVQKAVLAQTGMSVASADKEEVLQNELDSLNKEIAALGSTITDLKGERSSLDRDIKLLNASISRANLNIKAKNLQISQLGDGIADKARTVRTLSQRIEREKQSLGQ